MKDKTIKERGITLVALVITIVILLILAGVATAQLKDGGIITQGKAAAKKQEEADEYEKVNLAAQAAYIEGLGIIDKSQLNAELTKVFNDGFKLEGPFTAGESNIRNVEDIRNLEAAEEMSYNKNNNLFGRIVASKRVAMIVSQNISASTTGRVYFIVTISASGNKYTIYSDGAVTDLEEAVQKPSEILNLIN